MFLKCLIIAFIVFKKNDLIFAEYIFFTFLRDPAGIESQPH